MLATIMMTSSLAPTAAHGNQISPAITEISTEITDNNPFVVGGRVRSTEVVPLIWVLDEDSLAYSPPSQTLAATDAVNIILMPKTVGTHNNTIISPVGTMHSDWGRGWQWSDISAVDSAPGNPQNETIDLDGPGSFRVNEDYAQADFRFLEIRWGQARRATSTAVHNAHLYQPANVPITQTQVDLLLVRY